MKIKIPEILLSFSSDELAELIPKLERRRKDLMRSEPSIELAWEAGVEDCSYDTLTGRVRQYSGEAVIELEDGSRWLAIGHKSVGTPSCLYRHGFVEFKPLN